MMTLLVLTFIPSYCEPLDVIKCAPYKRNDVEILRIDESSLGFDNKKLHYSRDRNKFTVIWVLTQTLDVRFWSLE